jgi:hypothetical protein
MQSAVFSSLTNINFMLCNNDMENMQLRKPRRGEIYITFTRDSQKICFPSLPSAGNGMDEIPMWAERDISRLFST